MSSETNSAGEVGASRKLSQAEREAFLAEPHIAILSVSGDNDRPPSTKPTWYAYRPGGNIAVLARQGERKSRLIARAGKLALSVQRSQVPYKYVTVEGTVVTQQRPTRDQLLSVGSRYLPQDDADGWADWELAGANGAGEPEYIEIRPDRWLTADFGATSG